MMMMYDREREKAKAKTFMEIVFPISKGKTTIFYPSN
jgi:hypothetical protein